MDMDTATSTNEYVHDKPSIRTRTIARLPTLIPDLTIGLIRLLLTDHTRHQICKFVAKERSDYQY